MSSQNIKITVEDSEGDLMTMTLDMSLPIDDLFLKLETIPAFLGYHPNSISEMWYQEDVQSNGPDGED